MQVDCKRMVVFMLDLETTGVDIVNDRIVELQLCVHMGMPA